MAVYFAMVEGERIGPLTLDSLVESGVRPDTYVWAKGMDDWQQAADVADICRYFRQRLFDKMHPAPRLVECPTPKPEPEGVPTMLGTYPFPMPEDDIDNMVQPPVSLLAVAILLSLLCFPPTGFVAIYYSVLSRKAWDQTSHSESKNGKNLYTAEERRQYKQQAYDAARKAKMWIGITFFLGLIMYSFFINLAS